MTEEFHRENFEKYLLSDSENTSLYFLSFLAAKKYVDFVFPENYLTKESGGWYVRHPEYNNFIGRNVGSPEMAFINAAKTIADLKASGRFDSVMSSCYPAS